MTTNDAPSTAPPGSAPYAFDPELAPAVPLLPIMSLADIPAARDLAKTLLGADPSATAEAHDRLIPGAFGGPQVPVRIYPPATSTTAAPAVLYIHGGGYVMGDLTTEDKQARDLADELGAVVVSVGYRLAPEHPFPAALHDCFAALKWTANQASVLRIDTARIAVCGESAGGGLAAALALLVREEGGPHLAFQYLGIPQIDDRSPGNPTSTYRDTPIWNTTNGRDSWAHYLSRHAAPGHADVSPLAAPARAKDLTGLPPACVVVCQFDPLRDEGIAYATALAQAGVPTDLFLYAGTFHGSVLFDSAVSRRMVRDKHEALKRALHPRNIHEPDTRKAQHAQGMD